MTNSVRRFIQQPSIKASLTAFTFSRIVIVMGMILASSLPMFRATSLSDGFSQLWYRWDTIPYRDIAVGEGYWYIPNNPSTIAFFPVYPMLMRVVSLITHDAVLAGLLISQIAFFIALVLLYRITKQRIGELDANRTLIYISLFPTALFYFAAYSESVFLLFSLLTWYAAIQGAARRDWRWWLIAGLSGMLASATRAVGLMVVIFPLAEWLNSHNFSWHNIRTSNFWRSLLKDYVPALSMLLIPLGLLGFMAFLAFQFNDPLLFLRIQREGWGYVTIGPIAVIIRDVGRLIEGISNSSQGLALYGWVDLVVLLLSLSLLKTVFRYVGWAGTIYCLVSLLVPLSSRLESLARYSVVLFPMFMALAVWGRNPKLDFALRIFFIFSLVLTTFLFLKYFFVG